jgi:hypothetical protein
MSKTIKGNCAKCGKQVYNHPFARWYQSVLCRECWENGHYFTNTGQIAVRPSLGKVTVMEAE